MFYFQSREFYSWVAIPENSDQLPPNRMTSILMDMQGNQIALKGSGVFIITYQFLGTVRSYGSLKRHLIWAVVVVSM
jgi:hypothetical protein